MILFYIPFLLCFIPLFLSSIYIPKHLHYTTDNYAIVKDNIGVFSEADEDRLQASITNFYNQTHIPIEIITVYNSEWLGEYNSLEEYAYDLYLDEFGFKNENNWLLVYSQPEGTVGDRNVNWFWHGMQGDNTDGILTERLTGIFNENVQSQLKKSSKYSIGDAFVNSIDLLTENTKKVYIEKITFFMSLGSLIFIFIHGYLMIFAGTTSKKEYEEHQQYIKCPSSRYEATNEVKCEYCNGIYIKGTVTNCPYCGAAVSTGEYNFK